MLGIASYVEIIQLGDLAAFALSNSECFTFEVALPDDAMESGRTVVALCLFLISLKSTNISHMILPAT